MFDFINLVFALPVRAHFVTLRSEVTSPSKNVKGTLAPVGDCGIRPVNFLRASSAFIHTRQRG